MKLDYLTGWVARTLPEVYSDELSHYELLERVMSKLNEVITSVNDYFGKDITTYVSSIITGWRTDGTLDNIINGVFADLNTKVDNYHNEVDLFKLYINPKSLPAPYVSAKGDGTTDDTAAIQAAIDVAVQTGKRRVFIPGGTYLINGVRDRSDITKMGNIIIPSYFELWMSDDCTLKIKTNDSPLYAALNANNTEHVYIHGGKIQGDRLTHTYTQIPDSDKSNEWGHGITAQNIKHSRISDMTIVDCTGDGIYIAGIYPVGAIMTEDVMIERVTVDNCRRNGITLAHGKQLKIKGCRLLNINGTNPQSGIDIEGESAAAGDANGIVDGVEISGCYFTGSSMSGIALVNCKNIDIHDNLFEDQVLAIVPYRDVAEVHVYQNIFVNKTYKYAIQISCNQMKIHDNSFSKARISLYPNTGGTTLYFVEVKDNVMNDSLIYQSTNISFNQVSIEGNSFYNILDGYSAIESVDGITSDGLEVTGNKIRVTSNHGVKLQGKYLIVKDNEIEYAAKDGLHLQGDCSYTSVLGNVVKDWSDGGTATTGIYFPAGGNRITIQDNQLQVSANGSASPLAAIDLYSNAIDTIIKDNTITVENRTLQNGIYAVGSNILSVNNAIFGAVTAPKTIIGTESQATY
jgi:hypothetical protein